MGRHGGGSRSGGRSGGGGHGGGSRGGGSQMQVSASPFAGCYNRSYYYRGRYHSCYTDNPNYGTSKWRFAGYFMKSLVFIFALAMLVPVTAPLAVQVGSKVSGDPARIQIQDTLDLLTPEEEQRTLELFQTVYDASGMPVTLVTDDMAWQSNYSSIEVYSEELYYAMGTEEDAMLVLFTYDGSFEWIYDMYCGDDTVKCLSDRTFENLLNAFQKGMAGQNLCDALDHAFRSVLDDLATTHVDKVILGTLVGFTVLMVSILYFTCIRPFMKEWKIYQYFREHPEEAGQEQLVVKPQCPSCGAHNSNRQEVCEYCGTVLTL